APRFEQFLEELWPGDREAQSAVLEVFGLCLTDETKYQKMFMFVGPRRGGRGTIGRLLSGLIGRENSVGASLHGFKGDFALENWIGKKLIYFPDARLDGLSCQQLSVIAERLLRVSGEDSVEINRKYIRAWQGTLRGRVLIFSNILLRFQEDSGAL